MNKLDDAPYLRQAVANVTLLQKAAQHRCKVTVDYDSNTEGRRIRKVLEPLYILLLLQLRVGL